MAEKTHPGSFKLFRLFGITVYLHYLWFVLILFYAMYERQGSRYSNPMWNVIELVALFGIVLLHEFGHALACRSVGGQADRILLWPLGGIAFVNPPLRPGAYLWSIAAGPLVNVLLIPVTLGLLMVLSLPGVNVSDDVHALVQSMTVINGIILAFNMLPIYPLDGGQIAQSILWFFLGFAKSLRIVAVVGVIAAAALAILFFMWDQYFGLLVAAFIGWQSVRGFQVARMVAARGDIP